MDGYQPDTYGESFADVYDEWYADVSDVDATVAGIAALADGPILELGIGTGRLALPLAALGHDVIGVDASPAMLARLQVKPGAEQVTVLEADMAAPPVAAGTISVAFAAFNTFFNLTDAAAQEACAGNLAIALRPDGHVVIEGFVPPEDGLTDGGVSVRDITTDRAVLSASTHDAATQTIRGQHIDISADGITMRPWMLRYLTPAQLDDMFTGAGFILERRMASWDGSPFDASAEMHISVYRLPAA